MPIRVAVRCHVCHIYGTPPETYACPACHLATCSTCMVRVGGHVTICVTCDQKAKHTGLCPDCGAEVHATETFADGRCDMCWQRAQDALRK